MLAREQDPPELVALGRDFADVVDDHRTFGRLDVRLWQRHLGTERDAWAKDQASSCGASEERKGEREHDNSLSIASI